LVAREVREPPMHKELRAPTPNAERL
jgi:hypothetical protein